MYGSDKFDLVTDLTFVCAAMLSANFLNHKIPLCHFWGNFVELEVKIRVFNPRNVTDGQEMIFTYSAPSYLGKINF